MGCWRPCCGVAPRGGVRAARPRPPERPCATWSTTRRFGSSGVRRDPWPPSADVGSSTRPRSRLAWTEEAERSDRRAREAKLSAPGPRERSGANRPPRSRLSWTEEGSSERRRDEGIQSLRSPGPAERASANSRRGAGRQRRPGLPDPFGPTRTRGDVSTAGSPVAEMLRGRPPVAGQLLAWSFESVLGAARAILHSSIGFDITVTPLSRVVAGERLGGRHPTTGPVRPRPRPELRQSDPVAPGCSRSGPARRWHLPPPSWCSARGAALNSSTPAASGAGVRFAPRRSTEATVGCTWPARPVSRRPVPIGGPIPDAPLGWTSGATGAARRPGELYIGGTFLARGISARDLTADRFRPDPCRPGERSTGLDVAALTRRHAALLGVRRPVKIRGHRIELAEIGRPSGHLAGGCNLLVRDTGRRPALSPTCRVENARGVRAALRGRLPGTWSRLTWSRHAAGHPHGKVDWPPCPSGLAVLDPGR